MTSSFARSPAKRLLPVANLGAHPAFLASNLPASFSRPFRSHNWCLPHRAAISFLKVQNFVSVIVDIITRQAVRQIQPTSARSASEGMNAVCNSTPSPASFEVTPDCGLFIAPSFMARSATRRSSRTNPVNGAPRNQLCPAFPAVNDGAIKDQPDAAPLQERYRMMPLVTQLPRLRVGLVFVRKCECACVDTCRATAHKMGTARFSGGAVARNHHIKILAGVPPSGTPA